MNDPKASFERLYSIIARLRAPGGCPWDREQTPKSIRGNLIEEAYELVEAINEREPAHVCEEAGDLFLLCTMLAYMHEEAGEFTVADSLEGISDKLVRRHPHVFGDSKAATTEAVLAQWDDIKVNVEGRRRKDSLLDSVSHALPPLERAYRLQKVVAKAGFDWPSDDGAWAKIHEELDEARAECEASSRDADRVEDEVGDILYSVVNVSRRLGVDPAVALHRSVEKFSSRFRHVEKRMAEAGETLEPGKLGIMDSFWNEAKALESLRGDGASGSA